MLLTAIFLSLVAGSTRLEAESAQLTDVRVANQTAGFSGTGYVTDLSKDASQLTWSAKLPKGIYDLVVGYSAPNGEKGFDAFVSGIGISGMLSGTQANFSRVTVGRVEVTQPTTEITVKKGWGYYDLDYIELVPSAKPPRLLAPPVKLSDPNATPSTLRLFKKLLSAYGKGTFSGQYDAKENDHVLAKTGKTPAIYGDDFMDFSPTRVERGGTPRGATERVIERAKAGQIITYSWHWNAPKDLIDAEITQNGQVINARWYKGFYSNATTYDLKKALANPTSEDYRVLIRDIDVIAVELKKLANADVPVLWRPLHEAEGGWFWWGAKGPEPCKQLWLLMRDRLMNHHKLHNLIWVWNSVRPEWYPGDDSVDIIGADLYPADRRDATSSTWDDLFSRFNGKKLLALTEYGQAPEVDRMLRFGVRWSYFVSWTGPLGATGMKDEDLRRVYTSRKVFNLK